MIRGSQVLRGALLACALATVSTAHGDDTPPPPITASDRALADYERAKRLFEEGSHAEALAAIESSIGLLASPNSELLRAHVLRSLGRRSAAMSAYERAMNGSSERVRAGETRFEATLAEAGRWMAMLRPTVSELEITVVDAPEHATLLVDGHPLAFERTAAHRAVARVWREPGRADVVLQAPGSADRRRSLALPAGGVVRVELNSGAEPSRAALAGRAAPEPVAKSGGGPPAPAWVAAGVGVAGFVVFGVFGAQAAATQSDLLETCSPNCPPSRRDEANVGERNQTIANVGLVSGVAGVTAAALIWLLWPKPQHVAAPMRSVHRATAWFAR